MDVNTQPDPAQSAEEQLAELDLTVDVLHRAILGGEAERRNALDVDPPTLAGIAGWGHTVRHLRLGLVPSGWHYDNPSNMPRTIHPDRQFAIVVNTGDERTGLPGLPHPSTKYPRGVVAAAAVETNVQLALIDIDTQNEAPGDGEELPTWILLVDITPTEIRSELSFPSEIGNDGHIKNWIQRILLPPIDRDTMNGDTLPDDGNGPEFTVNVTAR